METVPIKENYQRGVSAFKIGDFRAAKTSFADCLRAGYQPGQVRAYLGRIYLLEGAFDKSTACFRSALNAGNEDEDCWCGLAESLFEGREYAESESTLHQALSAFPESLDARHILAKLLIETGRNAEAADLLESVPESLSTNGETFHLLGITHYRSGSFEKAIEALQEAIRIDPDNTPQTHLLLGKIHLEQGYADQALAALKRSAKIYPLAELYLPLAQAYEMKQAFETSLKAYDKALTLDLNRHRRDVILYRQGEILFEMGEEANRLGQENDYYDRAIQAFEQAIDIAPDFVAARHYLALCHLRQGQLAQSEQHLLTLTHAVNTSEHCPEGTGVSAPLLESDFLRCVHLGYVQACSGRHDDALLNLDRALALPMAQEETMYKPRILRRKLIILRETGQYELALDVALQLHELDPDNHYQSADYLAELRAYLGLADHRSDD
jgi:tetratricopeptide (TPR) repeat protein